MANTQPQITVKELTIVSKTKNSISIRWTKATDKETPQSQLRYTVTWCVKPYIWDNNIRKIGERKYDISSYTITGLTPNTTYDIIVYVRDADGAENVYAKATVTTLADTSASASSNTQVTDAQRREQINNGFNSRIIQDTAKALTVQMPGEESLPEYMQSGSYVLKLEKETHKVNDPSQDIFAASFDNIYPGAVVFANQQLADGNPTLCGLNYGTVTVRVNFNTGKSSYRSNVKNDAHSIQNAIEEILNSSSFTPPTTLTYKDNHVSSINEMAVSLGVSASFLKIKADVKTAVTSKESTITRVQDYTQKYYSVVITQESDKSKYFGNDVTWDKILKRIQAFNNAPLAIITSVTYGRRAYKFTDYASSSFKFSGSQSISGGGQSVNGTEDIARSSESKKTWMYLDGGDTDSSSMILKGSDVDKALADHLKFNAGSCQGVPLFYTVRFLASGKTATICTTGSYTTVSYKPLPSIVSCTFRNNATHVAGGKMKIRIDYQTARMVGGKKVPSQFKTIEYNMGFGNKVTFPLLEQVPGQVYFVDGLIALQIRCKMSSSGSWRNHVVGYIYPKNGVIDLDVHGAMRPGGTNAYIHSKSYTQLLTQ